MAQAVLVEERGDLVERARLEDVLEVGVPEPDPAEPDPGRVLAAVAQVEEAPLAAVVDVDRPRGRPVQPENVVRHRAEANCWTAVPTSGIVAAVADYVIVGAGLGRMRARGAAQPRTRTSTVACWRRAAPTPRPRIHVPAMFPLAFKSEPRLGPAGRGGAGPRRAAALPAARQGDRRLELDQRDDLPARQPARLRRLGRRRRDGVELRRGAPVLQALRGQRARRERVPRRRRAARRLGEPVDEPPDRRPARGGGRRRATSESTT